VIDATLPREEIEGIVAARVDDLLRRLNGDTGRRT
jgi:hypothetical protein